MHGRFLLLDSRVVEKADNARLAVGEVKKDKRNPLFREDKPWEPRFDNVYANVIYDRADKLYKCWYSPFIIDERTTSTPREKRNRKSLNYMGVSPRGREMGVCYAVSKDGIRWEKPEMGRVEFGGNRKNNILMRGRGMRGVFRGPHGAGVFKDLREPDPGKRYKMFFRARKMAVAFSADGVHWGKPVQCPQIRAPGDTHNNAFWAPSLGKYVGITRLWRRGNFRQVARTESPDFIKWTQAKVVLEGLKPHLQTHDMVVFPHAGVYIALVGLFYTDRKVDRQHIELAWSGDTVKWHRICPGRPLIPNSRRQGDCDWGCAFASAPIFLKDEIRIYYGANNGRFFDWRDGFLCLATLRPDGFAGYEQVDPRKPAFITTTPVALAGGRLHLSADVGKGGFVKVTLLNGDGGKPAESEPIRRTVTDAAVNWEKEFAATAKPGGPRLRFELKGAKLYSFSFGRQGRP